MNCPVCDAKLREVEKYGVSVDICPDCKGVWLDRGELEKIVSLVGESEAERPTTNEPRREYREPSKEEHREREHGREHDDRNYDPRTGKPKKKSSMLGEIFDMFGGGGDD